MLGINELLEQMQTGKLAEALQGCETIDELVAKAQELGYEVSSEDIEAATDLADEALESIAGGVVMPDTIVSAC